MRELLVLLGWGPKDGIEIRPLAEFVELFRLEDVTPSPAFFDVKKLTALFEEKAKSNPSPKIVKVPPRKVTGAGKALPADVREAAEKAFGYDLSKVRIHEDPSVKELSAKAYVSGHDIVFAPGASSDLKLLAHELAHVVQQRGRAKDGEGAI